MRKTSVSKVLRHPSLYPLLKFGRDRMALRAWEKQGRPAPPPHIIKERVVLDYAKRFNTRVFVESGTYLGQMVDCVRGSFDEIFSIELEPTLYARAKRLFLRHAHISILQGDSGEVFERLLAGINRPCLFWLDGHYSGGLTAKGTLATPVNKELEHILSHPVNSHVILIDDARCFTGANDYPTMNDLRKMIFEKRPDWEMRLENDIIRIHPPQPTVASKINLKI